jgi:hypothetical protein
VREAVLSSPEYLLAISFVNRQIELGVVRLRLTGQMGLAREF